MMKMGITGLSANPQMCTVLKYRYLKVTFLQVFFKCSSAFVLLLSEVHLRMVGRAVWVLSPCSGSMNHQHFCKFCFVLLCFISLSDIWWRTIYYYSVPDLWLFWHLLDLNKIIILLITIIYSPHLYSCGNVAFQLLTYWGVKPLTRM